MKTSRTFLYSTLLFISVFCLSLKCGDEKISPNAPDLKILSPTQNSQYFFTTNPYLDFQVEVSDQDMERLYVKLYRLQTSSYIDSIQPMVNNSKYYKVSSYFSLPGDIFFNESFVLEVKALDRMGNASVKTVDFLIAP